MRTAITRLSISAMLALATIAPVTGATAEGAIEPCGAPTLEDSVLLTVEGDELTFSPSATPAFGHDLLVEVDPSSTYSEDSVVSINVQLDLSGDATEDFTPERATIDMDLDWDDDVSDFDVYIKDANGTQVGEAASNTQSKELLEGGSGEQATLSSIKHCQELEFEVVNYSGNPAAALVMDLAVTKVR